MIEQLYKDHVQPHLSEIALDIRKDIIRRRIVVLERISADGAEYKHGAYAVNEAWSDLSSIVSCYFNHKLHMDTMKLFDLLDLLIDDLKKQKLIYLEW